MKIILSRKGFDSAAGGYANPILPDGTLLSLPIPDEDSSVFFSDLFYRGKSYYEIMRELHGTKMKEDGVNRVLCQSSGCHLDPDIRREAAWRKEGWKGIFGQIGSAQSHLKNQSVGVGDLFLYFGWFRKTVMVDGKLKFDPSDKNGRHIIYGYLQVGDVIPGNKEAVFAPWMDGHPHTSGERLERSGNTVYVARDRLSFAKEHAGFGVFPYDDRLLLTKEGAARSKWILPDCFRNIEISYHTKKNWKEGYFQSAARGQEFVIQDGEAILEWVESLFDSINDQILLDDKVRTERANGALMAVNSLMNPLVKYVEDTYSELSLAPLEVQRILLIAVENAQEIQKACDETIEACRYGTDGLNEDRRFK